MVSASVARPLNHGYVRLLRDDALLVRLNGIIRRFTAAGLMVTIWQLKLECNQNWRNL